MGLLGDFAKGFLIVMVIVWILAIISLALIRQFALAILLLIGFIIPLSFITYEYWKSRKKGNG